VQGDHWDATIAVTLDTYTHSKVRYFSSLLGERVVPFLQGRNPFRENLPRGVKG